MKRTLRWTGLLAALLAAALAWAEEVVTEVIPLKHRTLDEMVPMLRPLVPPPGTLTGMNDQLVVRTTPANLQALRHVVAKVDRPPRRLVIAVKQGSSDELQRFLAEVTGGIRSGDVEVSAGKRARPGRGLNVSVEGDDDTRANARVWSTRDQADRVGVQEVQVLEGREAFISTGQAVPVGERIYGFGTVHDAVRYQDVGSGMYVIPRLTGDDQVTVDINPHSARLSPRGGGKIDFQEANTVVSGRLGEWLVVGGSRENATFSGNAITRSTRRNENVNQGILLRVTELP